MMCVNVVGTVLLNLNFSGIFVLQLAQFKSLSLKNSSLKFAVRFSWDSILFAQFGFGFAAQCWIRIRSVLDSDSLSVGFGFAQFGFGFAQFGFGFGQFGFGFGCLDSDSVVWIRIR